MSSLCLSLSQARRLAIDAQLLPVSWQPPPGAAGVLQTICHLGYVQIDTLAVVQRAHHHTLWNRVPKYQPTLLHDLQAKHREVFEYWGHAASYLPMKDYRFYLPRMRRFPRGESTWVQRRYEEGRHLLGPVLERIRAEGPLRANDFAPRRFTPRGSWWDWKPGKIALELLLFKGDLMVSERRNFQRVYDLTERVLPATVDTRVPDAAELGRFLVHRALTAHGLAEQSTIVDHIRTGDKQAIHDALLAHVAEGTVLRCTVRGLRDREFFTLAGNVDQLGKNRRPSSKLRILSPFDNLVIHRGRMRQLFDFDFTIECYLPAAKRRFGYFSLPLLWKNRFVGRIDTKADRKARRLLVRSVHFEKGTPRVDKTWAALEASLQKFAAFNDCDTVDPVKHLIRNAGA